jgi:tetratricopeptide (TPR) repeat protein
VRAGARAGLPLLVASLAVAVFWRALGNGWVWDDQVLLVDNTGYRGLGWTQLRWMLTANLLGHYQPVTWLSHSLDHALWGLRPAGHHLTNVLLHALNAGLVYAIARHLLARATTLGGTPLRVGATVAALAFALHPLRVETVAWVTERRGVLAAAGFLAAVLLYLRAAGQTGRRRRVLLGGSVALFAGALLAKTLVSPLPLVLILLDLYPLHRLPADPRRWLASTWRPVWIEKLPYLVLGAAGTIVVYTANARLGTVGVLSPAAWLAKVALTLWLPVQKSLVPTSLSALYELRPDLSPLEPRVVTAGLGVLALASAAGLLARRRAWPAGLAVLAYQALMLAPIAGFVHAGVQLTADRYTYLATLGWALLGGAAAGVACRAWQGAGPSRRLGGLGLGLAAAWLLGLGVATWRQIPIWRDEGSLFTHAAAIDPDCRVCHGNLGIWHLNRGHLLAAITHLQAAARLQPDAPMVHGRLGHAWTRLGLWPEAIAEYRQELERRPDMPGFRLWLAWALLRSGQPAEAVQHFEAVARVWPREPGTRAGLAQALWASGEVERARREYATLRELSPALAGQLRARFEPA